MAFWSYGGKSLGPDSVKAIITQALNPIAYRGIFIPHHDSITCHSQTLKLWLPNHVTSCFYRFFPQFEKILAKSISQGGCYSHFSSDRS